MFIYLNIPVQVVGDGVGHGRNICAAGRSEVLGHIFIVSEDGGGGTNFCTHVADGSFSCTGDGGCSFAEIFDNGTCTALNGK